MNYRSSRSISTQAVWVYITFAVILQEIATSPANRSPALLPHHFTKRSFFDFQCKGVYDKSIFAKLGSICEDCYNLFRDPELHNLCRKNCFTTDYFKGCVETLQLSDQEAQIQVWIKQLRGAELGGLDITANKKMEHDVPKQSCIQVLTASDVANLNYGYRFRNPGHFWSKCFSTKYFVGCVESLLLNEEMPKYQKMIEYLSK